MLDFVGQTAIGLTCAAGLATAAFADDVFMNLGWATPLDGDYGILAKKFEELAEQYSGGQLM